MNAAMDNFLDFLEANHAELPARIEETQELSDEDAELIKTYVAAYKSRSGGGTL